MVLDTAMGGLPEATDAFCGWFPTTISVFPVDMEATGWPGRQLVKHPTVWASEGNLGVFSRWRTPRGSIYAVLA